MPITRLNHVCIATDDLDAAVRFYCDTLGLELTRRVLLEDRQLEIAFVRAGESELEIIRPTAGDNTVARFLERRGPGLHHICFETDDIRATVPDLAGRGAEFIDTTPHPGAVGMVCFIQPASANGVLVEINQPFGPGEAMPGIELPLRPGAAEPVTEAVASIPSEDGVLGGPLPVDEPPAAPIEGEAEQPTSLEGTPPVDEPPVGSAVESAQAEEGQPRPEAAASANEAAGESGTWPTETPSAEVGTAETPEPEPRGEGAQAQAPLAPPEPVPEGEPAETPALEIQASVEAGGTADEGTRTAPIGGALAPDAAEPITAADLLDRAADALEASEQAAGPPKAETVEAVEVETYLDVLDADLTSSGDTASEAGMEPLPAGSEQTPEPRASEGGDGQPPEAREPGAAVGREARPDAAEPGLRVEDIAPVALGGEDRLPDRVGPESRSAEPLPAGQPVQQVAEAAGRAAEPPESSRPSRPRPFKAPAHLASQRGRLSQRE